MLITLLASCALSSERLPESVHWPINVHSYQFAAGVSHRTIMDDIENQGPFCGACWGFAITSLVEAAVAQTYGQKVALSPHHILDCTSGFPLDPITSQQNTGCEGGLTDATASYLAHHGIPLCTETSYTHPLKWTFDTEKCNERTASCEKVVRIKNEIILSGGSLNAASLKNMVKDGPTAVALFTNQAFRDINSFDIFDGSMANTNCNCQKLAKECGCHAVVVVGYGVDNSTEYWTIANSWGEVWGLNGYARIARGKNTLGMESMSAVRVSGVTAVTDNAVTAGSNASSTTIRDINVNVNTEPAKHSHTTTSEAGSAAALIGGLLLCVVITSFCCMTYPVDYYPVPPLDHAHSGVPRRKREHVPEALPFPNPSAPPAPPDIVVVKESRADKPRAPLVPLPLAVPFPGPASTEETTAPPANPPPSPSLALKF